MSDNPAIIGIILFKEMIYLAMTRKSAFKLSFYAEINILLTLLASFTVLIFVNVHEYHDFSVTRLNNDTVKSMRLISK